MRAMAYFPLIGALIGFWAAAFYDAAASLWSPLVAAALSMAGTLWLTGCFHEDGLCDTLDGFGGGWTKSQILKIMRDSRNGSYATMGGCIWVVAKAALLATIGGDASVWALRASVGAGPCLVVAQCLSRASAAPLIYAYEYVVDDEDAKGEYYNWFGESRRLLGRTRVALAVATAVTVATAVRPSRPPGAPRAPRDGGGHLRRRRVRPQRARRRDGRLPRRDHLLPGARRLPRHRRRGPFGHRRAPLARDRRLAAADLRHVAAVVREAPRPGNGACSGLLKRVCESFKRNSEYFCHYSTLYL